MNRLKNLHKAKDEELKKRDKKRIAMEMDIISNPYNSSYNWVSYKRLLLLLLTLSPLSFI